MSDIEHLDDINLPLYNVGNLIDVECIILLKCVLNQGQFKFQEVV